jgi:hypothetical protein
VVELVKPDTVGEAKLVLLRLVPGDQVNNKLLLSAPTTEADKLVLAPSQTSTSGATTVKPLVLVTVTLSE